MAVKKYYIGSRGPFLFDDADQYPDGSQQKGVRTDAPVEASNVETTDLSNQKRIAFSDTDKTVQEVANLAAWIGGGENTTVADDGDGTVTVTGVTNEELQDKVAALLSGGENTDVAYDDAAPSLKVTGVTDEQLQDKVAAFLSGGTNVTLTYDDAGNALEIATDKAPAVAELSQAISDPPTQAEVQAIQDKVNELIRSLRNNVLNT